MSANSDPNTEWYRSLVGRFSSRTEAIIRVLGHSKNGLRIASEFPDRIDLIDRLANAAAGQPVPSVRDEPHFEQSMSDATFAENELKRGFPILNSLATVAIYGELDATMTDLAASSLINVPSLRSREHVTKVKVPVAIFDELSVEERMQFIIREISRTLNADFKLGVGRFEAVFDAIGLPGPVEDNVRRQVLELSQVRNVIAHRGGFADKRLVENCPWLNLKIGNEVIVTSDMFNLYFHGAGEYLLTVYKRLRRV